VKIEQLDITHLRVYDQVSLSFQHNTAILLGNNAQGKTSVLEAIHILAFTKSHRTSKDTDVIANGTEFAKIHALVALKDNDIELDIILSKQGKKAKYNHIEMERLSEYIGRINVVMFAPEDLELIKGNPKTRRTFLDIELGQISNEYLVQLQQYKRILKQRNDLLKNMQKQSDKDILLLDVITDQLIDYLQPIMDYRTSFITEIEDYANVHYKRLSSSNDELRIEYQPSVTGDFKKEYTQKYQYDMITGTTNSGVHRDEINFYLNEYPLKTQGSQGEQRTAVLAVKLALIDFIYSKRGEYPILLLDDVLSELDSTRQTNLLTYINSDIQTIITTTDINDIRLESIKDVALFEIEQGQIKECDRHARTQ
jgi:DNA replication and repair protein RecF